MVEFIVYDLYDKKTAHDDRRAENGNSIFRVDEHRKTNTKVRKLFSYKYTNLVLSVYGVWNCVRTWAANYTSFLLWWDTQSITKLSYIYNYYRLLLLLFVCVRALGNPRVKQIGFVSFVSLWIENHVEVPSVNVCKFVCLFLLLFWMVFCIICKSVKCK